MSHSSASKSKIKRNKHIRLKLLFSFLVHKITLICPFQWFHNIKSASHLSHNTNATKFGRKPLVKYIWQIGIEGTATHTATASYTHAVWKRIASETSLTLIICFDIFMRRKFLSFLIHSNGISLAYVCVGQACHMPIYDAVWTHTYTQHWFYAQNNDIEDKSINDTILLTSSSPSPRTSASLFRRNFNSKGIPLWVRQAAAVLFFLQNHKNGSVTMSGFAMPADPFTI